MFLLFELKFKFSVIGLIIFLLPMLINIVYFKVAPKKESTVTSNGTSIIEVIEQGSRILFAISICFFVSYKELNFKNPFLYLSILFLALYYMVWIRYFIGGMNDSLLGKNFLFVPIPLAIFPVLYFIFASLWMNNYIAVGIMIIFGVSHFIISYQNLYKK